MPGRPSNRLPSCFNRTRLPTPAQCRTYSAEVLKGGALGPIHRDEQKHQSFRVFKDDTKLPLPPLLDPIVVSERTRWQEPKAKPNIATFTPFQKKLWENPYGTLPAHNLSSQTERSLTSSQRTPSPPPSASAAQHLPCSQPPSK
jgi:hypothetical protein